MSRWRPRSSSIGAYSRCLYRAAMDRRDKEDGVERANTKNPPADFGTCCHWYMQEGMRCNWGTLDGKEGTSALHKYTPEQWDSGASLFKSEKEAKDTMHRVASIAIKAMPKCEGTWLAEMEAELPTHKGHIDFVSEDGSTLVDLKTTAIKPSGGTIKEAHLWQVTAYAILAGASRAYVLYVDRHGEWVNLSNPIDYTTVDGAEFMQQVKDFLDFLASDALWDAAIPQMGKNCREDFCPRDCRSRFIPKGSTVRNCLAPQIIQANPLKGIT